MSIWFTQEEVTRRCLNCGSGLVADDGHPLTWNVMCTCGAVNEFLESTQPRTYVSPHAQVG
jgi:hypothetical protein